jgi:hypothetical protein
MSNVGPITFAREEPRRELFEAGEVYTFRAGAERTTGRTWARRRRNGQAIADVLVEQVAAMEPTAAALAPYAARSGFDSVEDWQAAIRMMHGRLPEGHLYRAELLARRSAARPGFDGGPR